MKKNLLMTGLAIIALSTLSIAGNNGGKGFQSQKAMCQAHLKETTVCVNKASNKQELKQCKTEMKGKMNQMKGKQAQSDCKGKDCEATGKNKGKCGAGKCGSN